MTLFEELQGESNRWLQARDAYERKSIQFLIDFAKAFKEYIGAPDTYIQFETKQPLWYVQPVMARADENGIYSFGVAPTTKELLLKDSDGYWTCGPVVFLVSCEIYHSRRRL